jgi:hypothetical protein
MKAMLLAVQHHNSARNDIRNVVCCGLGALTGALPPEKVARQMALAYSYFILPRPSDLSWNMAVDMSNQINSAK